MTTRTAPAGSDAQPMRCMEIRGGSQAVEEIVPMPGLNAWIYSKPHEGAERGGDVHYLSLCGGGMITRLAVADVSGHGASVAEFSQLLRGLMRKNINTKSQPRLVRSLNEQFTEQAQLRKFATAVVATYLAHERRLTVTNAGHPRPLRFDAAKGSWGFLDAGKADEAPGNLPLGIDESSPYDEASLVLGEGDVVLFYTDALIEAADPSGRLLGEEGLLAVARGLEAGSEPRRFGRALLAEIDKYREGQPADDDVTLVVFRHDGSGPRRMSLGEKLDVYAKVFRLKSY